MWTILLSIGSKLYSNMSRFNQIRDMGKDSKNVTSGINSMGEESIQEIIPSKFETTICNLFWVQAVKNLIGKVQY